MNQVTISVTSDSKANYSKIALYPCTVVTLDDGVGRSFGTIESGFWFWYRLNVIFTHLDFLFLQPHQLQHWFLCAQKIGTSCLVFIQFYLNPPQVGPSNASGCVPLHRRSRMCGDCGGSNRYEHTINLKVKKYINTKIDFFCRLCGRRWRRLPIRVWLNLSYFLTQLQWPSVCNSSVDKHNQKRFPHLKA